MAESCKNQYKQGLYNSSLEERGSNIERQNLFVGINQNNSLLNYFELK